MPQYTSAGTTLTGLRVVAVYDTEAATVTYTVTDDTGKSASTTVPESTPGNNSSVVTSLTGALGRTGSIMRPGNIAATLASMDDEVHNQASIADAASRASGQPVPAAPTPSPPVKTEDNPNSTPAATTETVKNAAPATTTAPDVNNGAIGLGVDTTAVAVTSPETPNTIDVNNGAIGLGVDTSLVTSPAPATGYGNDPNAEFTTDSLGNLYKNGVLYRAAEVAEDPSAFGGLTAPKTNTQSQATQQDISNFQQKADWRVRLSLSPGATYLYKDKGNEGILLPLAATDGIIFPYTPAISVQYAANYDATEVTHSNYKFFQYKNSSVDSISLTCDFTAQDTTEANYLLAVIHFFRSVTKMFYGQDQNPWNGTPPPLCYLSGLGAFQFDAHPLAITNFTYALPTDVDYIRAGATTTPGGTSKAPSQVPTSNSNSVSGDRLASVGLSTGALAKPVQWAGSDGSREPTYVPTKMQITITAVPIITRNDISNNFSLKKYGTGALLQGTKRKGGGIW